MNKSMQEVIFGNLNSFDKNKIEDITKYLLECKATRERPNVGKSRFLKCNIRVDKFH